MPAKKYIFASSKPWHKSFPADFNLGAKDQIQWVHTREELERHTHSSQNIRYIFFLHWNWLVPESIWKTHECVCFHMTDVPYGRGGSPLQNLIVRGHSETMLTALRMVEEMDAGPVYTKRPLSLHGTAHEIYLRAGDLSFEIIEWMIANEPSPEPQQGEPVLFKRRRPDQSRLPENVSMQQLYDHIRMLDAPTYPFAFIDHGEFRIEFSEAELGNQELTAKVRIYKRSK